MVSINFSIYSYNFSLESFALLVLSDSLNFGIASIDSIGTGLIYHQNRDKEATLQ